MLRSFNLMLVLAVRIKSCLISGGHAIATTAVRGALLLLPLLFREPIEGPCLSGMGALDSGWRLLPGLLPDPFYCSRGSGVEEGRGEGGGFSLFALPLPVTVAHVSSARFLGAGRGGSTGSALRGKGGPRVWADGSLEVPFFFSLAALLPRLASAFRPLGALEVMLGWWLLYG